MNYVLVIALGGALGSVLRFLISKIIQNYYPYNFPLGIFTVNFIGCFLIGLLATLFLDRFNVSQAWRAFILIGFLGGFTTFSSFTIDAVNLLRKGVELQGVMYVFISVVFCLLATWMGIILANKL